jgi:hypothetical protein
MWTVMASPSTGKMKTAGNLTTQPRLQLTLKTQNKLKRSFGKTSKV